MKQYVLPVIALLLIVLITGGILKQTIFRKANAGLQINAIPQATVFLDGKNVGKTPYENQNLTSGEKSIRLVPESSTGTLSSWETKIKLINGTIALINREFGESESGSAGEIITLEALTDKKSASLIIISQPDSSMVKLDGEAKGFTPLSVDKIQKGDHQVLVSAPDYKERIIKTKFYDGFKTTINVKLMFQEKEPTPTPTPTEATSTGSPKNAKLTPTPTPKAKNSPTPIPTSAAEEPAKPYALILKTSTGWLRVRSEPSTLKTDTEIAKVYPGEKYSILDEQPGWYKISYKTDVKGWISSQYAKKIE